MLAEHPTAKLPMRILPFLLATAALTATSSRAADKANGIEFFEKTIRPMLVERCYECHSTKAGKVKGDLDLETKEGTLKGGSSGPAVVPGNLEKSLLIQSIRYSHPDLQMPPKNKMLSHQQIADFETWVKMGAPDPRGGAAVASDKKDSSAHWAFVRVTAPEVPKVKSPKWVKSPVDAFVLAGLDAKRMKPSKPADKQTLIRRVTYDLTGLPPTKEEVEAFTKDKSPDAYANLVDRLLNSPHYGERWGRYWLDIARYSDTKGYIGAGDSRYPYAYTYRDYVIRSFNEDLPYDKFITEQIAADQLKPGEDNRSLAALGFLTVGRRFINNENDIIDDRIDVVCRGLMGLTASCARCHDHKFDPIPTQDYYSLYNVFKSSQEPGDLPLLTHQSPNPDYPAYKAELEKRQEALRSYTVSNEVSVLTKLRSSVGDYLLALRDCKDLNDVKRDELVRGQRKMNMAVFRRWEGAAKEWAKTNHPAFTPWLELAALPDGEFVAKSKELSAKFAANTDASRKLNPLVAQSFASFAPTNLQQVATLYNNLFKGVADRWEAELKAATNGPAPTAFKDANDEALRQLLYADKAPANPPRDQFGNLFLFDDTVKNKIQQLEKDIVALDATHAGAPARAMLLADKPKPVEGKVFIRGNPGSQGDPAPRRFLKIASPSPERALFPTNASGRLQLAQAIVSRDNPLTARVFVNRVWQNHFGKPFVASPSDFGLLAEKPVQLDLLNYLAARFMDDGWSVKKLHKLILLSNTYQQSSADSAAYDKIDPENKLFWRMNRRRLDFEALRDSMLAISGKLDASVGGQPVDITKPKPMGRRTVYSYVDRQELPNLFRVFDFANPDTSSPQRFQTIVAPQALYMLNSDFVVERTKGIAERANAVTPDPKAKPAKVEEAKVRRLYEVTLQREPSKSETKAAVEFLRTYPGNNVVVPEVVAWRYGYGTFDEASGKVTEFNAFTNFNGKVWQSTQKPAVPGIGALQFDAEGGQPAATNGIIAIRRWVAPRDGKVSISALFAHSSTNGDGLHARIVSSSKGVLGDWIAFNNQTDTRVESVQVKEGDTIDFLTDCRSNNTADAYKWAPSIQMMDGDPQVMTGEPTLWDARQNFGDPNKLPKPLTAWEELAQVLLLSNEFVFLD